MKKKSSPHRPRAPRPKRPSRLDVIIETTVQSYTHDSTEDVTRRRQVLVCEAEAVNDEIASLQQRLAQARADRQEIDARLIGLTAVIARR